MSAIEALNYGIVDIDFLLTPFKKGKMWIGGFLIVGAAAHAAIFMVRFLSPYTSLFPANLSANVYCFYLSKMSIAAKLNTISFHTSQAAASSGLHLEASRITSLPSRARSRPSLRTFTHASRATRLATAPGALPQG